MEANIKVLVFNEDLKLTYKRNDNSEIIDCYVDAHWAGDHLDRKSTTGYVIRLFGNVIYWKWRKQKRVTKASTCLLYTSTCRLNE